MASLRELHRALVYSIVKYHELKRPDLKQKEESESTYPKTSEALRKLVIEALPPENKDVRLSLHNYILSITSEIQEILENKSSCPSREKMDELEGKITTFLSDIVKLFNLTQSNYRACTYDNELHQVYGFCRVATSFPLPYCDTGKALEENLLKLFSWNRNVEEKTIKIEISQMIADFHRESMEEFISLQSSKISRLQSENSRLAAKKIDGCGRHSDIPDEGAVITRHTPTRLGSGFFITEEKPVDAKGRESSASLGPDSNTWAVNKS